MWITTNIPEYAYDGDEISTVQLCQLDNFYSYRV